MKGIVLAAGLLLGSFIVSAQVVGDELLLGAVRISTPPDIDGLPDDEVWKSAKPGKNFVQQVPNPGQPCTQKSEIYVLYDNVAIYVGAKLFDDHPDSIMTQLTQRDEEGAADHFGVLFDTYNDDINAFGFFVSASGVQLDARYSAYGYDFEWNAVWQSAVELTDYGWAVELKIPYSALRIPQSETQSWGINFERGIRRNRQMAHWATIYPQIDGFVNQFGRLTGLSDIDPPVRLSVTPYVSGYLEHYSGTPAGQNPYSTSLNGGLDLKYGINDAFTLDLTLIPDFGQVQSDNLVLNLSPFEIQFNEFRQFFKEGTELFSKGDLFYTRRIGGEPLLRNSISAKLNAGDSIVTNPLATQLINAAKMSGRTQKGTGIGIFNAVSAKSFAGVESSQGIKRQEMTSPLTNYNVFVVDQNLRNNSYATLINTNVIRQGDFYDANVTATEFWFAGKEQRYSFNGGGALSQLYYTDSTDLGHSYNLEFAKIRGNFRYALGHDAKSDRFDPNDLGLLFRNNERSTYGAIFYNRFKPFGSFLKFFSDASLSYRQRYAPSVFTDLVLDGGAGTALRNFLHFGMNFEWYLVPSLDYFEPRVNGRYFEIPSRLQINWWVSSNYANRFAYDVRIMQRDFMHSYRAARSLYLSPRYRVSDKLSFIYEWSLTKQFANQGFVNFDNQDIIMGERDIRTIENILRTQYTFTNTMNLTFRLRHYWSVADYLDYYALSDDGKLLTSNYAGAHDVNFNAFNIDMVYTWVFAPGSEIRAVWKNSILTSDPDTSPLYIDNLDGTLSSPQLNSFSLKILYFIDYLSLVRK